MSKNTQKMIKEVLKDNSAITINLCEGMGHPWNDAPGFEMLGVKSENSPEEMKRAADLLGRNFWQRWVGNDEEAWFYRKLDAAGPWKDINGDLIGGLY